MTKKVYAGLTKQNGYEWKEGKKVVTEDFKRCVVQYCSESVEFEVDGMKFRATTNISRTRNR
jgi:hypothetical protein